MRRLVPLLLAAIACAACTPPIYDPSASLAATTLDRVPTLLDTGYLDNLPSDFRFSDDTYTFMPERMSGTLSTDRGFVIRTRDRTWNQVSYVWHSAEVQWIVGGWEYSVDDPMLTRWTLSLKNGSTLGAVSIESPEGEAYLLGANTGTWGFNVTSTGLATPYLKPNLGLATTPQVVGVSVNADAGMSADKFRVLMREGISFSEGVADVNSMGLVSAFAPAFAGFKEYDLSTFLGTPWHLRYFHEAGNVRSFAQSYNPTKETWATWVWWNTSAGNAALPEITHRIDAVLSADAGIVSSSFLFSTEDQMGRVYQYDGAAAALVAEFPLGSLWFIGEAYVYGAWRMLFSRCLLDTAKHQLRFQIRAINTADLVATFGQ